MSNPIERAELAVTEARRAIVMRLAEGLPSFHHERDTPLIDNLIRAVEARCAERHCRCYPHPNDHEDDCPHHAARAARESS